MYRYRLFEADDNEQGEAYYAVIIEAGDIIWADDRRKLRVRRRRADRRGGVSVRRAT
jgi:hypothetical protein